MRICRIIALACFSYAAGQVAAAEPPSTQPVKPAATSPSTGPAATANERTWSKVVSVQRGRKWSVVLTLKEGAGPAEIRDQFRLEAIPGQIGLWSPHFMDLGFKPGKITSAGGFPGGHAFNATCESEKEGQLTWSGATFAGRSGVEHAEVKVLWEKPDGTKTRYEGRATPGMQGSASEAVAAAHLLSVFGEDAGVKMRLFKDAVSGPNGEFLTYEYQVGEGEKQKQGVLRLLNKGGFWKPANQQPSPEMALPKPGR